MPDGDDSNLGAADRESVAVVDLAQVAETVYRPIRAFEAISRYRDLLANEGIEWGLLGPREIDRLWGRHILNSAAASQLLPDGALVVDIGSGAGLPGIPIAVLRPDLRMDLVEPMLRRSTFLARAVDELGIADRVEVVRSRAEDVNQSYDAVLSRALAPLDRLIRWCLPMMRVDGQVLAIKGRSAAEELHRHQRLIASTGLVAELLTAQIDPRLEPTTVVRLRLARSVGIVANHGPSA